MLQDILSGNMSLPLLLLEFITLSLIVLVVLPVHEMAHGYVAYRLGDPTAKNMGRLTPNPLAHLDPIGTLMIFLLGFGYAKAVPVNPYNFRNPKTGMALTALAGPVSNLLMAVLAVGLYRLLSFFITSAYVNSILYWMLILVFASVNVGLAVFNLLPIPPLDVYRILSVILPDRWIYLIGRYENYLIILVMFLIFTGVLSTPISFVANFIFRGILMLFGLA